MVDDSLDRTLLLEVSDRNPSEATIDLESFDEDTLRNESEGWRFLEDTIIGCLIKSDGVLRLVFNFALGPLLLLGGFATGWCWCCCFGFSLKEGINTTTYPNRMNAIRLSIPRKPRNHIEKGAVGMKRSTSSLPQAPREKCYSPSCLCLVVVGLPITVIWDYSQRRTLNIFRVRRFSPRGSSFGPPKAPLIRLFLPGLHFVILFFIIALSSSYKPGRGLMAHSSLFGWAINYLLGTM